jgi:hypothetical protein
MRIYTYSSMENPLLMYEVTPTFNYTTISYNATITSMVDEKAVTFLSHSEVPVPTITEEVFSAKYRMRLTSYPYIVNTVTAI